VSVAAQFRFRLRLALMVVVSAATAAALLIAERELEAEAAAARTRVLAVERAAAEAQRSVRQAAMIARCRDLAEKPRIHAALEDDALDLLYPSAESELAPAPAAIAFYRFLDRSGRVIPPPNAAPGRLEPAVERRLDLPRLPDAPATGFLAIPRVTEVVTVPIRSTETNLPIAAVTMGFKAGARNVWVPGAAGEGWWSAAAGAAIARAPGGGSFTASHDGMPEMVFFDPLPVDAGYPPAYQVSAFSLAELIGRERRLRWQIGLSGGAILLLSLLASMFVGGGLAVPVERLAQESERSARFSADASHQLKTPVTVMRAGLEELLRHPQLTPGQCAEISALVHQTYRLATLIDDLLLLARLDAGRLRLDLQPVDLSGLIEAALDDAGALTPEQDISVQAEVPAGLSIAGERRYTAIILQNLLENARKYNRPGGRIRVRARGEKGRVQVDIGNSGSGIPAAAQAAIFERFHRGSRGENEPGYGLGLNLARELARLHGGDLSLLGSTGDWTEFRWTVPSVSAAGPGAGLAALPWLLLAGCILLAGAGRLRADALDDLDQLDAALNLSAADDQVRAQVSGLADLEGFEFQTPPPGLIRDGGDTLGVPRLSLFLDAQAGSHVYAFAQYRVDTGFDPQPGRLRGRLDEYAVRVAGGSARRISLQLGKFATIVGNWTPRHDSWTDPFVTPPLPYDNLTGIWDAYPADSTRELLEWAHVLPYPPYLADTGKLLRLPILWGPSYATGASLAGATGGVTYAVEVKNASLSSRPDDWNPASGQFRHPTVSARAGYAPDEAWSFGASASEGPYLDRAAAAFIDPGLSFAQYREIVFGQDAAYAHHHFQAWAEVYETRFEIPGVANADTLAYYVEAKQTFAPEWFGAARWNQQLYGTVPLAGVAVPWGADVWRADLAVGHRFNARLQAKLQYSAQQGGGASPRNLGHTAAAQLTLRL
jgi:signal transduction histidine kinase